MPIPLHPVALRLRLQTNLVGHRICHFDQIDSTNTFLRNGAARGLPDGTVALADFQTAGRGQHNRSWIAPPRASVLCSTLLYPDAAADVGAYLSMIAGNALAAAVEHFGVKPGIKWPNDLVAPIASASPIERRYRKLGGVLLEGGVEDGKLRWVVVGTGLNINFDPSAHPEIASTATSLRQLTGAPLPLAEVVVRLLHALDERYLQFRDRDYTAIFEEWRSRLVILGQSVTLTDPGPRREVVISGVAEDVLPTGELLVRADDGSRSRIPFGEVSLTVSSWR